MIRVARLIPVLDFGGVETTFEIQAAHIDRSAFDFQVVTFWKSGAAADRIRALGVGVTDLGVDPAVRNPRATVALARYLREHRPDILHASIGEANFHSALVGRWSGVPITIVEEQGVPARRRASRLVHAALYRRVDAIVAVSAASRDYLVEREFAPLRKTHILPNAASAAFFTPPVPRAAGARLRVVTVGRLVDVKNQATLIDAFAPVARAHPGVDLEIIGDGPLRSELEARIGRLGLQDRVKLPGFRADVREQIDAADVFVLPSLSEGFGIALVEAMARARPVIAATAGALPSLMGPLGARWMVAPRDTEGWTRKLTEMVALSGEERAALGREARQLAERFSPTGHVAALEALYRGLLESPRARRRRREHA